LQGCRSAWPLYGSYAAAVRCTCYDACGQHCNAATVGLRV
jgi:hypothetical protein